MLLYCGRIFITRQFAKLTKTDHMHSSSNSRHCKSFHYTAKFSI